MLPPIPGTRVQDPQWLRFLRGHVSELVQMNCRPSKFPGAQPVSFASHHIQELCEENYFVSEKADGVRCLMFTTRLRDGSGETFLIDRKNEYYKLDFGLMQADGSLHVDTLLDGELVFEAETDKQTGEQRQKLFFLFFDALVVDGKSLCDRPYTKRLGYLREFVVKPHLMHERKPEYTRNQPFRMVQKRLEMSYNIATVFEHMRGYKHKTDGVIFTSAVAPYMSGTCPKMLKWKPSEENTVDFKIISIGRGPTGSPEYRLGILESSDRHSDFGVLELDEELKDEWRRDPPLNRIIECRYDPQWPSTWRFSRFRDDKMTANHISTYHSIIQSIEDNVSMEELIEAAPRIERAWREREARSR